MGMFDSFYFDVGVLPDNKEGPLMEFQTKDLHCMLNTYFVDYTGHILNPGPTPINKVIEVYSYDFLYSPGSILTRQYLGCNYQEYSLIIRDNQITHIERIREKGY